MAGRRRRRSIHFRPAPTRPPHLRNRGSAAKVSTFGSSGLRTGSGLCRGLKSLQNKRHGFLAPIVAEVRQSGPWTAGRDGPPGLTFETNGTDSWRRLLQKFVRADRGRPVVTGRREGLLKQTARIPGADCCRSPSERAVGAGRGRPVVTGRREGLLKQTARIPVADCFRSPSERAVDGRP